MALPTPAEIGALLTIEQRALLDVVNDAFWYEDEDPAAGWVLWSLRARHQLAWTTQDLATAIRSMPVIGAPFTATPLRLVGIDQLITEEHSVRPTLLGVATYRYAKVAEHYVKTIAAVAKRVNQTQPSIKGRVEVSVTGDQLVSQFRMTGEPERVARSVAKLLLSGGLSNGSGGTPNDLSTLVVHFGLSLSLFESVSSTEQFLEILCQRNPYIAPSRTRTADAHELLVAIDHFNAIWRLSCPTIGFSSKPLFQFKSAESISKLLREPETLGEFESLLSALGQILQFQVPIELSNVKGPPGSRVSGHLAHVEQLDDASRERCKEAFATLDAVGALRNSQQHGDALPTAHKESPRLGVQLPVIEPKAAWAAIRLAIFEALVVLREELAPLSD